MRTDSQSGAKEKRTKLKPVRFAPSELAAVAAFLSGRDFSSVVRAYVLGSTISQSARRRGGPDRADVSVVVAFSSSEWTTVIARLAGGDASEVLRSLILGRPLPEPSARSPAPLIERRRLSEFEAGQFRHLSWIGNNLNQLAKQANIQRGCAPNILPALLSLGRAVMSFTEQTAGFRRLLGRPTKGVSDAR